MSGTLDQHNEEIWQNVEAWKRKPVLREVYRQFHQQIAAHLQREVPGPTIELGSGIGQIKEVIPDCVCTDLFPNPWIDRVESAYALTSANESVANLILFDVFHHLRYPGTALREFSRVLVPGGRLVIFEPYVSLLGRLVYGAFHREPLGWREPLTWLSPPGWTPQSADYYAAQGNATRVFFQPRYRSLWNDWQLVAARRLSALSYVASGGYRSPQLYPQRALPALRRLENLCDRWPRVFATRTLVVLEKNPSPNH